ncbi:MAG TPA: hypothetical protein VJT81_05030, partial [Burkholderiales bacterium]|nr:hypothetical protein [Burkholderiales bacterium]
ARTKPDVIGLARVQQRREFGTAQLFAGVTARKKFPIRHKPQNRLRKVFVIAEMLGRNQGPDRSRLLAASAKNMEAVSNATRSWRDRGRSLADIFNGDLQHKLGGFCTHLLCRPRFPPSEDIGDASASSNRVAGDIAFACPLCFSAVRTPQREHRIVIHTAPEHPGDLTIDFLTGYDAAADV